MSICPDVLNDPNLRPLHGTLPSSMTVEPEPTREHLAERLSVLERELAQAKRTILALECERDEATTFATLPDGKPFTLAGSMAHVTGLERERDALKRERDELWERCDMHTKRFAALMAGRSIQTPELGPVRLVRGEEGSRPEPLQDVIDKGEVRTTREGVHVFWHLDSKTSKPRPDLIPAEALLEAGACMAGGLERDDPNGQPWYETAPRGEARRKYRRSLLRHVLAWYAGDKVDSDSGKSPLAHIICNASILFWLERRK